MPDDGFAPSLTAALDAAATETEFSFDEPDFAETLGEEAETVFEQADTPASEQPEATDEIASILEAAKPSAEDGTAQADTSSPDFWQTQVEVETSDGPKRVSFDEMKKGYMRHADYTKKTQEVARERQLVNEAVELHKSLTEDPSGFARYIAAKAGLIDATDIPDKAVKLWTEKDVEAEVEKRVEAKIADHPQIKEAQKREAVARVEAAFGALETKYNTKLTPENRMLILQEAQRQQASDLDFVFQALLYRGSQKLAQQKNARKTATNRPTVVPQEEGTARPKGKLTPAQAMALALQELGASP